MEKRICKKKAFTDTAQLLDFQAYIENLCVL